MIAVHPYIRYAQALIMAQNNLDNCEDITPRHIILEIEKGLESFRLQPTEAVEGKNKVKFGFARIENGNPKKGIFLSPNIISTDKLARYIWKEGNLLLSTLNDNSLSKMNAITTSVSPVSGEYLNFSLSGKIGRGSAKVSTLEYGLSVITTLTQFKPCLQYRIDKKGKAPDMANTCIIPDLAIEELKSFIQVFKWMLKSETAGDLFFGNVVATKSGKGGNETIAYEAKRPLIFRG
ncbi:MAG: hypothetical protein LHW64_12195, partial [Candidatus Cloacimonetes bacterium]|nr:hypothetical protein [Candidatus Cloacimonadota bacterium]MDY0230842.1 hypothetical protein [Candidatus Cloacimonadaceae bacterium]